MDQLTGAEPYFDPEKYNANKKIQKVHNCYDYAINHLDPKQKSKSQPGLTYMANYMPGDTYSCRNMHDRLMLDHPEMYKTTFKEDCRPGFYKIALVVDPDDDYHFLRQDRNGTWSHKPGPNAVINTDFSGNPIYIPHPDYIDLNNEEEGLNYSIFCNYYCVNESDGHFMKEAEASRNRNGNAVPGWEYHEQQHIINEINNDYIKDMNGDRYR